MTTKPFQRVTLFKVPKEEDQKAILEAYRQLDRTAVKDGKPYIQTLSAGLCHPDQCSQGYTVIARVVFASKADMDYYDNECEAHQAVKAVGKGRVEPPPLIVYFEEEVVSGGGRGEGGRA